MATTGTETGIIGNADYEIVREQTIVTFKRPSGLQLEQGAVLAYARKLGLWVPATIRELRHRIYFLPFLGVTVYDFGPDHPGR